MVESGTGFAAGPLSAKRGQKNGTYCCTATWTNSRSPAPVGPVPIQADTVVWVRAHMNTGGYGGMAFKGSVKAGFKQAVHDAGFAADLAKQAPLPDGCDF